MSDGIDFDDQELVKCFNLLERSAPSAFSDAHLALKKGVTDVTNDMRTEAKAELGSGRRGRHASGFPSSISYDEFVGANQVTYEVGPAKGRLQGPLGNLLYFGSANNGAVLDFVGPLSRRSEEIVKFVGDAFVEKVVDQ